MEDLAAETFEARSASALYTDLSRGGIEKLEKRIEGLRDEYEKGGVLSELDRYFVVEWDREVDKVGKYDSHNLQFMATVWLEAFIKDKLERVRLAPWSEYALGSWADRYRPKMADA